jgi:glutathione S-transferase
MAEITLFGPPQSSYVRTARMVCVEKGVSHELKPIELGSDDHERLHPFKRVPVMRHGDLELYETQAIARYIDAAFDGPSLTPNTPAGVAVMEQWISAINCYIYNNVIRDYALVYVGAMRRGTDPDRAKIEASLPKLDHDLGLVDGAYANQPFIGGEKVCLADLFVAPVLATIAMFPEGKAAVAKRANLSRALDAFSKRESFKAVHS